MPLDHLQTDHAIDYGNLLLNELGHGALTLWGDNDHPAVAADRSGLTSLSGKQVPLDLASQADGTLLALEKLSNADQLKKFPGSLLLSERARIDGLTYNGGKISVGGSSRLLRCRSGWISLSLAREEDWALVHAWLEEDLRDWNAIQVHVQQKDALYLEERGSLLGLSIATCARADGDRHWLSVKQLDLQERFAENPGPSPGHQPFEDQGRSRPLILDFSALWAGPLASSLLQLCGAHVIKVEGKNRPDGARNGNGFFYDLLNSNKDCVAFDPHCDQDMAALKKLITRADIIIEASPKRVFQQWDIDAQDILQTSKCKIWASITAYGQKENRIGFGDDIGIGAGLGEIMRSTYGEPSYIGDAITDPLSGLHLALAIFSHWRKDGCFKIDLSMKNLVSHLIINRGEDNAQMIAKDQSFDHSQNVNIYPLRPLKGKSKPTGADNEFWLI